MLDTSRQAITPFWNRIPRFFLYPLHLRVLPLLLGLLLPMMLLPAGLFGLLLRLVIVLFFVKYCLAILADTAEGRLQPPPLNSGLFMQGYSMPFKLLAIYVVLGIAQYQLSVVLGLWAVSMVGLLGNLLLPAMIMSLAVSSSLIAALTPTTVFSLIWRIGWPYLVLYVFINLLYGIVGGLLMLLQDALPLMALLTVLAFAMMYVSVIAYNVMGYVMYQYADALGLVTLAPDDDDGHGELLADYRRFMAEENYPAALEELRSLVNRNWQDLELHRLLHKMAKLVSNHDILLRHGQEFIPILLDAGHIREATEVYRSCVAADKSFRPNRPLDYQPIAQMLRDSGQARQAIVLINGFHKRFPKHDATPGLYMLAAQAFHADIGDEAQARKILNYTVSAFPQHALRPSIERYLTILTTGTPLPSAPSR
jgi:hypothetical protein